MTPCRLARLIGCSHGVHTGNQRKTMPEFQASTTLNCPVHILRQFLGRPSNLPDVSDPDLELEIVAAPEVIAAGETIEFRVTAYGFKQRSTHTYVIVNDTEILEEQIDGPMRSWRHHHRYEAIDANTCRLVDQFEFEPPGGMMGFVFTEAKVRESLEEGMRARYESLARILENT
jgi:ligand-binding SRPBCC domain-containing protein